MQNLKDKFKQKKKKRLSLNLTQKDFQQKWRSLGSIKDLETSGEISFESLLKLALVLNYLDDFKNIANKKDEQYDSMDDLLKVKPIKKRSYKMIKLVNVF